ncbi:MAG: amidase [Vicinamibacteria bacterium]
MAEEHFLTVTELSRRIATKELSPVELLRGYLARAEEIDLAPFELPADPSLDTGGRLASILTLAREEALAAAKTAENEILHDRIRGPLHGIPYGVKDLLDTRGIRTTWGSRIFRDRIPDRDATVIAKLSEAGAILMAKMSLAEFAGGNSSNARNPWKLDRSTHGSSSGTAVGAVAGLIGFGIGTETGGSIVLPSATCGATGLRPTFGRVSRHGCMPLSWCLDKIGPVARSAADCGLALEAIAGPDPKDPSTFDRPFSFRSEPGPMRGRKVAVHGAELDAVRIPENRVVFDRAIDVFRQMGVAVEEVTLPRRPYGEVFSNITAVEGGAIFQSLFEDRRIDGMFRYNWSRRAAWFAGMMAPASDYVAAQRIRQVIVDDADEILRPYAAVLAPTSATGAGPRDDVVQPPIPPPRREPSGPRAPRLNTMANLAGLPGINVPCGFDAEGMPLCLQIVGAAWEDQSVLDLAMAFQKETTWHQMRPPFPFRE